MTVTYKAGNLVYGLSSDTKPTTNLPVGYRFFETDSGQTFSWDGALWTIMNLDKGKTGWFLPNSATTVVGGNWNQLSAVITTGINTGAALVYDSTDGVSFKYIAGATINSQHGLRVNQFCDRNASPTVEWRLKAGQITNCRIFFGLIGASAQSAVGADPLPSKNGVLWGLDTGVDGNWHIYQNNATGTDSSAIANVATADTNTHYFGLRANGGTFEYRYARGTWTTVNTKIPASTSTLGMQMWIENLDASVENFSVYEVRCYQPR